MLQNSVTQMVNNRPGRRQGLLMSALIPMTLAAGMVAQPLQAQPTLPSGGKVVAGEAQIGGGGANGLTISQGSQKAIIDWDNFSIGAGGSVFFDNGNGATLNRVRGTSVSSLNGRLGSTGSVYLINPNGVIIGQSGVVKVGGGFVASTLDVSNDRFMAGGPLAFSGNSLAEVVNLGRVGALGGDVALMAVGVRNEGQISAPNGTAALVAGRQIILQDTRADGGNFLIVRGGADSAVGTSGVIEAASVELRAEGGNVYALAGNTQGIIRATGVSAADGRILLTAGSGKVSIEGAQLLASDVVGNGGHIALTGGDVRIGSAAHLSADAATATGSGGTVVAFADMDHGHLAVSGQLTAQGGGEGGHGGFVETSGAQVDFTGARVDTSAAQGLTGNWLVDPYDLTVDTAAAATISGNLATTNVTLQTTAGGATGAGVAIANGQGDINIDADISWASGNSLTLDAYRDVNFYANVQVTGAGGVVLKTGSGGAGDYGFFGGKSLSYTGGAGTLNINGQNYTLLHSLADIASLNPSAVTLITGQYALAQSLDATDTPYTGAVLSNAATRAFVGTFTGLGNTVSNVKISAASSNAVGFFGYTGTATESATIRDFGLINPVISNSGNGALGTLIGGTGGLTTVRNVFADNYTLSAVRSVGGLVGSLSSGSLIENAYATGSLTFTPNNSAVYAGGMVGEVRDATINNAYADVNITTTGTVASSGVGGLVGRLVTTTDAARSAITNAFSTGAINVEGVSLGAAGGLIGRSEGRAASKIIIDNVWSTTILNAPSGNYGQLVGNFSNTNSIITNAYYASDSGNTQAGAGAGSPDATSSPVTALTRGELQSLNFDGALWSTLNGHNPYLNRYASSGQASGSAALADGSAASGATIGLYANGGLLATTLSGADGQYGVRYFLPKGVSLTTGLGATLTLSGDSTLSGATYDDVSGLLNVISGTYGFTTAKTSLSALDTDLMAVFGSALAATQPLGNLSLRATGDFALDEEIAQTGRVLVSASAGKLTLLRSITSEATGDAIVLASGGGLVQGPAAPALSTPNGRWLAYSAAAPSASLTGTLSGRNYYNTTYDFSTDTFSNSVTGDATLGAGNRFVYAQAATLTVTPQGGSKVYDGLAETVTSSLSGYLGADAANDSLSGGVTGGVTTTSKNVGTYSLTATGDYASDMNYQITYGTGSFEITPKTLTAVLNGTVSRVYDGTDVADLNGHIQLSGFVGSETASASGTGTFDNKNVGSGKTITATGVTLSGADAGNYVVDASASGAIGEITPASLTLSAVSDTRMYNGNTSSSATPQVIGLIDGDTVTDLSQSFASADVADNISLSINAGYVINDGNGGHNYTVTTQTAFGNITHLLLQTLNWAVADDSSVYGSAHSLGGVTLSGVLAEDAGEVDGIVGLFRNGDAVTVSNLTAAGTYASRVTGLTGTKAGNYQLASTGNSEGVYIITPKLLTVTLTGSVGKVYDGTTAATLTAANYAALSGIVGSDDVTLNTVASGTYDTRHAGSGKTVTVTGLTLNGTAAGNYSLSGSASGAIGAITPASLTLSAVSDTRVYNGNTTSGGMPVVVSGLVGTDTATGLTQAFDSKDAGNRTLTVNGYVINDGNSGHNYTVTTQSASGSITPKALTASLAGEVAKTYDGMTAATLTAANYATLSGIVGSDDVTLNTVASGTYDTANAGTGRTVSVTGLTLSGASAGNYSLASSLSGMVGVINKVSLTLTGRNASKTFGEADPVLGYDLTAGALVGNDSLSGTPAREAGETAGAYAITQGTISASANYAVTFVPGVFTIDLPPAQQDNATPTPLTRPDPRLQDILMPAPEAQDAEDKACARDDEACQSQPYPSNRKLSPFITFAGF